jgi:hypothetical protein
MTHRENPHNLKYFDLIDNYNSKLANKRNLRLRNSTIISPKYFAYNFFWFVLRILIKKNKIII